MGGGTNIQNHQIPTYFYDVLPFTVRVRVRVRVRGRVRVMIRFRLRVRVRARAFGIIVFWILVVNPKHP